MASATVRPDRPWTDPARPLDERVDALLAAMTLDERLAQLGSVWVGVDDRPYEQATRHGIGQLTRIFGTRLVGPAEGARQLAALQRDLLDRTRLGVPAIAHEECLSGFTAFGASAFPTPLALAATFDPDGVERMAHAVGAALRQVGVHQGLAPVLDVVRDYRWGRVEETLGEDPYLVGLLGAAYVRGLQAAGVIATPKHFAGHSGSRAGRNLAPVSMGPRELHDVVLPPFEMALREGGARSVMHAYAEVDGVPAAADEGLLTGLLRDRWGFEGVVVADYFAVPYLETLHRVAGSAGEAAALALRAGVDVELPTVSCYGRPLAELVRAGEVPESLVDRAVRRVLRQKAELGLLDAGWAPEPPAGPVRLDPPENRALARTLAERSVVLLANRDGVLPLAQDLRAVAVVGPCADDPLALLGDYSFPNHVLHDHPDVGLGIEVPSLLAALRAELPQLTVAHEQGCHVTDRDRSGFQAAVRAARSADLCLAVVGDRAGLFGLGTSGEGSDAEDLALPGVQDELVGELLGAGTPVVLVVVSGRPYALGRHADRLAAAIQAFFPGEEGGPALAGVLSGRVVPSGKLPVQVPRGPGGQPGTYLHPPLGGRSGVSSLDPTPLFPFGHGLSYTTFTYGDLLLGADEIATDGEVEISCTVRNVGERAGAEVVQLYLDDPVAQVTRPLAQLAGVARVALEPGRQARVTFRLHADRTSFTGVDCRRVVEPGEVRVLVGASSADIRLRGSFRLVGEVRQVGHERVLVTAATVAACG
jgi:beta-glucosidase